MCAALFSKPKMPQIAEAKLPRQPIRPAKAATFEAGGDGFGSTRGRTGGRSLRIKRQNRSSAAASLGGFGEGMSIGAQVPV